MHWENVSQFGPLLAIVAALIVCALASYVFKSLQWRRHNRAGRAHVERYWALEAAHRAKMRAVGWVRGSRTRKLTWQPVASDGAIAGTILDAYGQDMTDHSFETRLARAKFRAWHRGTREADFTIGGFFDRHHAAWSEAELALFEDLLEEEDDDILGWAMAAHAPPEKYQGRLMSALQKLDYVAI